MSEIYKILEVYTQGGIDGLWRLGHPEEVVYTVIQNLPLFIEKHLEWTTPVSYTHLTLPTKA